MKRKKRISIWVTEDEKAELEDRAQRAGMLPRRFYREFLFRRVRNRLDATIYDEVHRVRIELNKHGGLLVQMRNRIVNQRISKDVKDELLDALNQNACVRNQVVDLKSSIETKLGQDDHKEDIADRG